MLTGLMQAINLRRHADLSAAVRQVAAMVEEQQIEEERADVREEFNAARAQLLGAADHILYARLLAKTGDASRMSPVRMRSA